MANILVSINVITGDTEDIAKLPTSRYFTWARFIHNGFDPATRLMIGNRRYRLDLKKKKLIEDNTIAGEFHLEQSGEGNQLFYKGQAISEIDVDRSIDVSVSPDGRHTVWKRGFPARKLYYYDQTSQEVRIVDDKWLSGNFL